MSSPIFPNISVNFQVGETPYADGSQIIGRAGRLGDLIQSELQARFYEMTKRQRKFALMLAATTTGIAAGNITGAAAAASTQFALVNPASSGVDLVLNKVWCALISGTLPAAPMTHDLFNANGVTLAKSGKIQSAYGNTGRGSVAWDYVSAAGAALTGAGAHIAHRLMALDFTAAAFADAATTMALEVLDGDLVIPPGVGWAPCFSGAGTSVLNAWGVTWDEVPV